MSMRLRAALALSAIFNQNIKPKNAIDNTCHNVEQRDRAFVMQLVYGTLRNKILIDRHLSFFLKNPDKLQSDTLNNLRIAVFQLLFTDMPAYAAVNEAVNVEKGLKGNPDLVNAVLRNLLRKKSKPDPFKDIDEISKISLKTSHPIWLVQRWVKRFGPHNALALAEANNIEPPLTLRFNTQAQRDDAYNLLLNNNLSASKTKFSPTGLTVISQVNYRQLLSILKTFFAVQDEASQIVSLILNPHSGASVLDLCAAPGGKTLHIASMITDRGKVLAVDIDERRMAILKANIKSSGLNNIETRLADINQLYFNSHFDYVLVDAPCSGIGVIRRNPDIKYNHSETDLHEFQKRQLDILNKASSFLHPKGMLLYSVCSTEPEEGEEVVEKFLQQNKDFCNISLSDTQLNTLTINYKNMIFYRTFPHIHGLDGFFIAKLQKR